MLAGRTHLHSMAQKERGALYATYALLVFAEGLVTIFVPVLLWKSGFPLWKIMLFYFMNALWFVAFARAALPLLKRMSDKMMIFLSMPLLVAYFAGLGSVGTNAWSFYILPALAALATLLFDIGYNLDFTCAIDTKNAGREIGFRNTLSYLIQFCAPFAGGFLIAKFGFGSALFAASGVLLFATAPLFFFPRRALPESLRWREVVRYLETPGIQNFNISCVGYGAVSVVIAYLWPFSMFFAVGGTEALGGIVSAGIFAAAVASFAIGRAADAGERRPVLALATAALSAVWIFRMFDGGPATLGVSNAVGAVVWAALMAAWTTQYYKISHAVADAGLFILSREVIYNVSRALLFLALAAIAYALPFSAFFPVAFGFAAVVQFLFVAANRFHTEQLDGLLADRTQP